MKEDIPMSNAPLYKVVYQDLLSRIVSCAYPEKSSLPSERELCEQFHVSRSTVRRALDALCQDGYINKMQGRGNFIRPQMYEQPLSKFHSFAGALKARNIEITNQILSYELIDEDKYLGGILKESARKTKWHKLVRLRNASGFPLMIETTYLPQNRFYRLDIEYLKTHSLYFYLDSYYCMKIDDANELLSPVIATNKERQALQIPQHIPCMLIERFCYESGELIAIHKTTVRGDKYKFRAFYYANE